MVKCSRDEALIERRRRNLRFLFLGLLSRVVGVASRSRTAFPLAEVSLESEAALLVSSQSAPPSARIFQC